MLEGVNLPGIAECYHPGESLTTNFCKPAVCRQQRIFLLSMMVFFEGLRNAKWEPAGRISLGVCWGAHSSRRSTP